jgi:L-ribulokinase
MRYSLGVDYGTNSCRAVLVDLDAGTEAVDAVYPFPSGVEGVVVDDADQNLARQEPADYLSGLEASIGGVLARARAELPGFRAGDVVGVGVATTGSTPLPVDRDGTALALLPEFADHLAAKAWLWKDHTGHAEAVAITRAAREHRPHYVAACGGTYSAEWFWAKIWHCLRTAPEVFRAARSWVELCDYLVGVLTGRAEPGRIARSVTAAGHKAMYAAEWGGLPDAEFLARLDPALADLRARLYDTAAGTTEQAGGVSEEWSARTGLVAGTPVAVGHFDAHAAAVAGGVRQGVLVKVMGTSTCDVTVMPLAAGGRIPDVPGVCGVVAGSVLPGAAGVEAGQSAVGDLFRWFADNFVPARGGADREAQLRGLGEAARKLRPGEHGLVALDWLNGNRSVLVDQRLSGLVVGLTLHTRPHHVYQALIEATAFGARRIIEQIESAGQPIEEVVAAGGLPWHSPYILQTYADVMGRPVRVARSRQGSAFGAALTAAVAAGVFDGVEQAQQKLTGVQDEAFRPDPGAYRVYDRLYRHYLAVHDAFGGVDGHPLGAVMKDLLDLRDETRAGVPAAPGEGAT